MQVNPSTPEAYRLFHEGTLSFARAERQGFRIDMEYAERKKNFLTKKIARLENEFKETNFYKHWEHTIGNKAPNIYSPQQLGNFLYKTMKQEVVVETKSKHGSISEDALEQMGIPDLNILVQAKKLKKVRDTYLEAFIREQVNGYIHPSFNLHLVQTYRSSSDGPNFQNIPVRDEESMQLCRGAIYPRPGHLLLEADFKSIEVGVNACINKDPMLMKYVSDPTTDMHRDMAMQIFLLDAYQKDLEGHQTLRQAAKNGFVFPEFYGSWYKNCATNLACNWGKLSHNNWKPEQGITIDGFKFWLSDQLISKGINSLAKFTEHIKNVEYDFWNNRFAGYSQWKEQHWLQYQRDGYIDLPTGFRCSGVMSKRQVNNYPGQGSASHCLLWSFNRIDEIQRKEQWDSALVGQIHDSALLDVHPDELDHVIEVLNRVTCTELSAAWKWITVPLMAEIKQGPIDGSWAQLKKLKINQNNLV